jgi:hypothetical protein
MGGGGCARDCAGALEKQKLVAAAGAEQTSFFYFQPVRNPVTAGLPKFISVCYDAGTPGKFFGRFGFSLISPFSGSKLSKAHDSQFITRFIIRCSTVRFAENSDN